MTSPSSKKTFSLAACDWIGFDLDHTLIRYRLVELHTLIYELLRQYLIDTHQYTPQLSTIPYDPYFGVKALIYDSLHGNLFQLDAHGIVHTAIHGVGKRLSSAEIKEIYPNALQDIEEDTSKRFLCIFTYFEHCISYLIGNLVDFIDRNALYDPSSTKQIDPEHKYSFFLADLNSGFTYLFGDFNRGNYFSTIQENPSKFIYQRPDVRQWLEKLKANKKRLFLGTNSRLDYTNLLTSYAFGEDWRTLFDLIIVDCKKPSFFSEGSQRGFQRITDENNLVPVTNKEIIRDFNQNCTYAFGNSEDLHSIMREISQKEPVVIYFGDHIKSDINALKRHTNWLAGVVIEELEFDVPPTVIHTSTHQLPKRLPAEEEAYTKGHRSKYFSSFFTSPRDTIVFESDNSDDTKPDAELPALSSYWYTYIAKHAHLSLSCLSVLANQLDPNHEFEHEQETNHFVLLH